MARSSTKMTAMQRKFVENYLAHGNATRAAKEAGFGSPHVAIVRLMRTPHVKAAIESGQKKSEKLAEMSREEALKELANLARGEGAPQAKDRIAAMALLAKLVGWEAPKKLEHSGPGGGAIQLSSVTRAEAAEALREAAARDPELAAELKRLGGGS